LVGANYGSISESYATGAVAGMASGWSGGLVGNNSGAVTASFYDIDTIGQATGCGGGDACDAVGLTTTQMQDPFRFIDAGWDFAGAWSQSKSGANDGYMMLRAFGGDLYDYFVRVKGDTSKTYGDANPDLAGVTTIAGIDDAGITVAWDAAIDETTDAGTYAYGPGVLDIQVASGNASDYYFGGYDGALEIGKAALTVTAQDAGKTYDGLAFTGGHGVTYAGFANDEDATVLTGTLQWGGDSQGAINAGTYDIEVSGLSSGNYDISYSSGELEIGKAALTVTAGDAAKIYDGLAFTGGNGLEYSGFVNGEDASVLGGELQWGGDSQGAVNAGNYDIEVFGLSSGNYDISYSSGELEIGKAALTVTAGDAGKTYDGLAFTGGNGVTYAGFANGEDATVLTGTLQWSGDSQGAINAGNYDIEVSGLSSDNYDLSFTPGTLSIGARAITVTADDQSRVYGDDNDPLTWTVGGMGLVNGDGLSGALATAADTGSNVGDYVIGQGSLSASDNYALSFMPGTLSIGARAITVTADDQSRIYGDDNPALSWTVGGMGLVNGDSLSGVLATDADVRSNVGDYAIEQGSLSASDNYDLSFESGTLSIGARAVIVTADDQSRIYGDDNPALSWTVGGMGLVNGDSLSGVLATDADARSNVGDYVIGQGSLSASDNYDLSFTPGTLSIGARAITVTADDQSRIYGDDNPALSWIVGGMGLVNGDSLGGSLATAADVRSSVGDYAIEQGNLTASPNYALSFTPGVLGVAPRPLLIVADDQGKYWSADDPLLGWQVGGKGLVNGDRLKGQLARAPGETPGTYAIGQGSLMAPGNYAVDFRPGTLTIAPVLIEAGLPIERSSFPSPASPEPPTAPAQSCSEDVPCLTPYPANLDQSAAIRFTAVLP